MTKRDFMLPLGIVGLLGLALMLSGFQGQNFPSVNSGDGVVFNTGNTSGSLTLANAPAGSLLGNGTAASAAPTYQQAPSIGAVGGTSGVITYLGATSGSITVGCASATCVQWGSGSSGAQFKAYNTATNCAATGTAANPSAVACGSATAGAFSCATNASTGTCVISTTSVTAASRIQITPTSAANTLTCNATADTGLTAPRIASQSANTSFTINLGTFSTTALCFYYTITD